MNNLEVVGLGALNIDHLYQVEHILSDGETVTSQTQSFPGGSAANTIYGLAKLGISTGFSGMVGDDDDGRMLIKDLQQVGVDTNQVRITPNAKTGSVLCLSDRLKRCLYVTSGANSWLTSDDLDLGYINQATMLHISSFVDDKQFSLLRSLIDKLNPSIRLSFTPGELYAKKGLRALAPILHRTDILFINHQELHQLTGRDTIAGAESCLKQGSKLVVVTLGGDTRLKIANQVVTTTYYIKDVNHHYVARSIPQPIIPLDTTGAGDAFATGFLYGIIKGKGIKECGRLGDTVAQLSIRQLGARPGLPTLSSLAQYYQQRFSEPL
ncbi:MAG: carbohydrate kinase family protein [Dehalococcoidales bacterium]|nr:carbohydrate kinase family protein [Dehalococcoidales bacterium]